MQGLAFFEHLGLRMSSEGDAVAVEADVRDDLRGPFGLLQGGVVTTLVDVSGASCAARAMETHAVATTHLTVEFLAPGRTGPVVASARPLRANGTTGVAEVRVSDTGEGDRLMAVGLLAVRRLAS